MRLLFLSDTHLGHDLPRRPRALRPRRGAEFFESFEAALAPARAGEVDAVLHAGDLLYRSRVPAWLSDAALAPLRAVGDAGTPVLLLPGNHERGELPHPLLALRAPGLPPVFYSGSTERTSSAEARETKGVVLLWLSPDGLERHEFRPLTLPATP
jgi:DNA repair exonuclease SbcCD nuclease subunit